MTSRTALLSTLLLLALATGCAAQPPATSPTVVYGTPFQPNTLNPITAPDTVSRSAIEMIFDGLVAADDRLQLRGELAEGWETSGDGKELVIHLRQGVRWHDGEPFTADDVKFTYDKVIDPNSKPTVSKADYAAIQSVEVVDSLTVRFRLSQGNAAFISKLVLGIAPKHLLEGQDLATAEFNNRPVGTGPFIFESWSKGESMVLRRNPDYFGTVARVEKLVWKVVPDSSLLAVQVSKGEVDGAPIFNPKDAASIKASGKVSLYETLEGNTQISLQLKNPLLQDKRVRQALAYAIDRDALIDKIMMGAAIPATSDILPTSWAYNPDVSVYPHDPGKARSMLAEAGWKPGPDGILAKDGQRMEISLMTDAGHKAREQVMLAVRQYWQELGIEVKTAIQERNSFVSQRVLKGDFDAVLLQSSVQVDPDLSRRFHSASIANGQNFLNYKNPEVDRLLAEALAVDDIQRRKVLYSQAQRIIAEDLPQISLFHPKAQYGFNLDIEGVRPSATNLFWNAEEWTR